ncbi:MAG: alpha-amylase family glycosyl hydrolase [Planctomycetota bacterium]|nr:alpha-amylase family glycosyl hydrolase [Planctomycetota bacterium]
MSPRSVRELDFGPRGDVFPSPVDWRDQFMYQLLLDRFDDNKDAPPYKPESTPRGRDVKQSWIFQGGNLKGVTRRLDYIKNLGCTTIWISPPFKQRQDDGGSYHGYAIQDFLAVDPRFGTLADLQELVRQAHQRGMYVILDIVINHTADCFDYHGEGTHDFKPDGQYEFGAWHRVGENRDSKSPLSREDAVWPVELQDPDCFSRRGSIRDLRLAGPEEAVHGDFFNLKDLNLSNPKSMDALIQSYKYWIAIADIDGYRVDTVRNIPAHAAAIFCNAIHEYAARIGKHNFMIFGEIVGDDDLLHKYIGGNTPVEGAKQGDEYPLMDACLDFPLYAVLDEVIKGKKSCDSIAERYSHFNKYFRNFGEAGRYYVTFIDNHDQSHRPFRRFLNNVRDDRLGILGIGFLLCNLGIPCVYYGTEQGFDGGGDRDTFVRECMFGGKWGAFDTVDVQFFNDRHSIYQGIAAIAKVRREQPALRYGREYFREISGDGENFGCPEGGDCTLALSRVLDTDEVLIVINISQEARNDFIEIDGKLSSPGHSMVDLLAGGEKLKIEERNGRAAVRVPLAARQIRILKTVG